MERLRGIPAIGIQGRLDLVCPAVTAYKLHKVRVFRRACCDFDSLAGHQPIVRIAAYAVCASQQHCCQSVFGVSWVPSWIKMEPFTTSIAVLQAWPELRLRLVGGAGHSQYDPAITHELVEATDAMRNTRWVPPSPQLQVAVY